MDKEKIRKAIEKKFLEIRGWKDWKEYDSIRGSTEGDINCRYELIEIAINKTQKSSNSSTAQQDKINSKTKITEENLSPKTIKGFEYKCICDWSKDDKFGFIPNTKCPVHGKETKLMLSKTVPIDS